MVVMLSIKYGFIGLAICQDNCGEKSGAEYCMFRNFIIYQYARSIYTKDHIKHKLYRIIGD